METQPIAGHEQHVSHHYQVHYPEHEPRSSDPHYHDFEAYKRNRKTSGTYHCDWAMKHRNGDFSECDLSKPLECHHSHIEWAMLNEVDLALLEKDYPGVSNPAAIGAWAESADNLELLCVRHHRGHAGKHVASYADFEAQDYVRNLLS